MQLQGMARVFPVIVARADDELDPWCKAHTLSVMTKILIIADDLSGAADCAATFAQVGMDTLVVLDAFSDKIASPCVIAVDADSRRLTAFEAARVHQALQARYYANGMLLYKKMDSTLRGNFAAEVAAAAAGAGLAIVAPAFPKAGRTTRGGCQYLHGIPLEQGELWRIAGMTGAAAIPAMLECQGLRTVSLDGATLRQETNKVAALLASLAGDGVQAVVCDAETDDDLYRIAQASLVVPVPCFWAGSAGLAAQLAMAVSRALPDARPVPQRVEVRGAILTVVGSMSSVSRRQAERLKAATQIACIRVDVRMLREGPLYAQWRELQQELCAAVASGRDLLLTMTGEDTLDGDEGLHLCQALATLVSPLSGQTGAVIATGGETARALLCAMGYHGLRLQGEIEAGVPVSMATGPRPLAVVTKAGAFGEDATLLKCYQALAAARSSAGSWRPNPNFMKGP
jgi:uncharacterized protein YgbK (DUF1537 family)